jgi:hypothetical protein
LVGVLMLLSFKNNLNSWPSKSLISSIASQTKFRIIGFYRNRDGLPPSIVPPIIRLLYKAHLSVALRLLVRPHYHFWRRIISATPQDDLVLWSLIIFYKKKSWSTTPRNPNFRTSLTPTTFYPRSLPYSAVKWFRLTTLHSWIQAAVTSSIWTIRRLVLEPHL